MSIPKIYSPTELENKWYQHWLDKGYFHSTPDKRESYTIVIHQHYENKVSLYYTETYDFSREINLLSQIYYNDPLRLKNLRLLIIESLNDKKLIEKFQEIFNRL